MIAAYRKSAAAKSIVDRALTDAERLGANKTDLAVFRDFYTLPGMTVRKVSEKHFMAPRTVYRCVDRLISGHIMPLMFGVEGIPFEPSGLRY